MRKALLGALLALSSLVTPVTAQSTAGGAKETLGYGRFFNNDTIGDGGDRWRTGSYTISKLRGPAWTGTLPNRPGELLEYRLRTEIIAPSNLSKPSPLDRRYVGALSLGVHTHFNLAGADARLGADLVATGPNTRLGALQREFHSLLGMKKPGGLGNQIPNAIHPTLSGEIGRTFRIGPRSTLHPFAEAQYGAEDLLRVGGDLVIGDFGAGALLLRDVVTGHRYQGVRGSGGTGLSLTLGADVARVFDSAYLPDGGAAQLSQTRTRLRAGLNWKGERSELFYGLTRLGKEYDTQSEGQTLGSLSIRMRF